MPGVRRYQDPEVYERLAGEYVLGTLRGRACRRFEGLMQAHPYIRHAVERWQERLDPLGELAPAVQPPQRVWRRVREATSGRRGRLSRLWRSAGLWRAATLASLLLLVGGLWLIESRPVPSAPAYVAVLEDASDRPMMVATASRETMEMRVRLVAGSAPAEGKIWRLWAVLEDSGEPIPVGRITPDGETRLSLSRRQMGMLDRVQSLVVSAEPAEGSPSGRPTGPMLYKGPCLSLA